MFLLLASQYSERAFHFCLFFALIVLRSPITMFVDNSNRKLDDALIDWMEARTSGNGETRKGE